MNQIEPQSSWIATTAKRHILVTTNSAWNIVNFRSGLLHQLIRQGYAITAAAPQDGHEGKLVDMGCDFVPLVIDNKGTNPVKDLHLLHQYLRLMQELKPDAVLSYTIKPNVYASFAAALLGIAVINNVSGLGTTFIHNNWLTKLVHLLYRSAFRKSSKVFFQNEDDRSLFVRHRLVERSRTQLLPGSGIDLDRFQPLAGNKEDKSEGFAFLLIARLLWDKGVGEFVDAAKIVGEQEPNARFQLLGFIDSENRTAIDRATVEQWVTEGIVEYLGVTEDVRPFINAADCVVLPSYREGTPRSLLEAAALAKPLIASDVPGCRNVVDDAENGFLCRVKDHQDLAARMLDMIKMDKRLRLEMGLAGRRKVEDQFDEQLVIDAYLRVLDEVMLSK